MVLISIMMACLNLFFRNFHRPSLPNQQTLILLLSPSNNTFFLHIISNTDVDAEELANAVQATLHGKPRLAWEESR